MLQFLALRRNADRRFSTISSQVGRLRECCKFVTLSKTRQPKILRKILLQATLSERRSSRSETWTTSIAYDNIGTQWVSISWSKTISLDLPSTRRIEFNDLQNDLTRSFTAQPYLGPDLSITPRYFHSFTQLMGTPSSVGEKLIFELLPKNMFFVFFTLRQTSHSLQ